MAVMICKASGKDIRAIMAVELHISEKGNLKRRDESPEGTPSRWVSSELQRRYRPALGEDRLVPLKESVIVAKDGGKMVGYGLVIGEREGVAYGWENGKNYFDPLPAVDDLEADRRGHFQIAYRKGASEEAIRTLFAGVVEGARNHPQINKMTGYVSAKLAKIANKVGFKTAPEIPDLHCVIRFQGKVCEPRVATIMLKGKEVPDTKENREAVKISAEVLGLSYAVKRYMERTPEQQMDPLQYI